MEAMMDRLRSRSVRFLSSPSSTETKHGRSAFVTNSSTWRAGNRDTERGPKPDWERDQSSSLSIGGGKDKSQSLHK